MLSRRAFVSKLAAGAAGASVAWAASLGRAKAATVPGQMNPQTGPRRADGEPVAALPAPAAPEAPHTPAGVVLEGPGQDVTDAGAPATASAPPPWALLHPLAVGSVLAHGWRVAELTGVVDGTCVLTLRNRRGRTHRVHLCRNDGRPQGLVYTERFDLLVMNGGQRDLPTEEGLAQAVGEVAHVLAANERRRAPDVVAAVLPHAERVRLYSGSMDRRLR